MKKNAKHLAFYLVTIGIAIFSLIAILNVGQKNHPSEPSSLVTNTDWLLLIEQEFAKNMAVPITGLLIQILIILLFSRICASILKAFGQPQVIGEMIAGILLGKSVLAYFWPAGFETLFPDSSMPRLYFLSQIGLIFFMFVVGLDLKVSDLKNKASAAILVSHVSIVLPFLLGALLALGIYDIYEPPHVAFSSFALFMGIAMSITAFPVLARIIQEKKLTNTPLGTMAITCAAIDDVTAWCVLAAVLGIVKAGSMITAVCVLGVSVLYVMGMLKIVKPSVLKILRPATTDGKFTRGQLAFVFFIVLASALISEIIGIHALFGAFLAGTIMPQSISFRSSLIEKIEDLSAIVLLPIFFAYTGIRTQISLLDSWDAWFVCGCIIILAIIGKMVGSAMAARWAGMSWRESWALGALMNTRGLMELIVLNIGYDLGILSPIIFSMMVVMAIVTTAMTGPLLSLFLPELRAKKQKVVSAARIKN
jgi:Kef-type K+ transport system membrane component KefB